MKTIGILLAALVATFTATISTTALAQDKAQNEPGEPATNDRLGGHAASSFQLNPNVIKLDAGVHYRRDWFQVGAGVHATPSYVAPALQLEAFAGPSFSLKGEYAYMRYTAEGRGLIAFASKDASYDTSVLERRDPRGGGTHRVTLTPNGKLQLGPVLLKMKNDISYLHTSERGEAFYLPDYDVLVRKDDVFLASRTDVLFQPWKNGGSAASGLAFGPSLQSTWAIRTSLMRSRVGATIGYTPADSVAFFQRPTIVLDVGVNATDEHHQGEGYGALALSTEL
ncbi:MAG: hypothetical protein U0270_02895 [Labilithrix sp.]